MKHSGHFANFGYERILRKDQFHCPYCGVLLSSRTQNTSRSRDHVVPKSRGGAGQVQCVCCYRCNQEKGNLMLAEWRAVLSVRGRRVHLFWFERQLPSLIWRLATWYLAGFIR
jgi:hypothetical protein